MSRTHKITYCAAVVVLTLACAASAPLQAQLVKVVGYDGKVREIDESKNRQPKLLKRVEATYTREAWEAQIKGNVEISFKIESDGVPTDIEVIKGLGMGLDEQAVAAVTQWRFQPPMRDGEVIPSRGTTNINFRMREDQRYHEE